MFIPDPDLDLLPIPDSGSTDKKGTGSLLLDPQHWLKDGTLPVLATEVSGSTVEPPVISKNVDKLEPMSSTHLEICLQGDFFIQEVTDV
jgi:hypothetical protein